MANENFGLSFTVEPFAIWADNLEGTQGAVGEITPIISSEIQGAVGEITPIISSEIQGAVGEITPIISFEIQGAVGEIDVLELCAVFSVLSGSGQSALSGPGQSVGSCP